MGWSVWVGAQPPPLSISASPRYSAEPSTLTLTLRIPRDPLNRSIDVILESDNYYSASSFEHPPTGPTIFQLFRRDVPAGEYTAIAYLHRSDGKTVRALAPSITVLERVP